MTCPSTSTQSTRRDEATCNPEIYRDINPRIRARSDIIFNSTGGGVTGDMVQHLPVDILVNNAGIQFVSPIEQFPVDKWEATGPQPRPLLCGEPLRLYGS